MIKALATKRNALLLALYVTFVFWYSHFGGPITAPAQAAYITTHTDQGISEEQKVRLAAFMASDDGNDFVIVNLIHLNPSPETLPATGPGAGQRAHQPLHGAHARRAITKSQSSTFCSSRRWTHHRSLGRR